LIDPIKTVLLLEIQALFSLLYYFGAKKYNLFPFKLGKRKRTEDQLEEGCFHKLVWLWICWTSGPLLVSPSISLFSLSPSKLLAATLV